MDMHKLLDHFRSISAKLFFSMILISMLIMGILSVSYVSTYNRNIEDYTGYYKESFITLETLAHEIASQSINDELIKRAKQELEFNTFLVNYDLITQDGISLIHEQSSFEKEIQQSIKTFTQHNEIYYEMNNGHPLLVRKIETKDNTYYLIALGYALDKLMINNAHILEILPLVMLIIIMIVIKMKRRISGPIQDLVDTIHDVPNHEDFSIRHHYEGRDEISLLVNSFNEMLSKLQSLKNTNDDNQKQLWELAHFDSLSGFPNRVYFKDLLGKKIAEANRFGFKIGVFYIDLDNFKVVNDTLGHDQGDELLKQVSKRLKECLRNFDLIAQNYDPHSQFTISRMGGDEFLIFIPHIGDTQNLHNIAKRILKQFDLPFKLRSVEHALSVSLGVSVYPDHAHDITSLMTHADIAMLKAKKEGKGQYLFFEKSMLEEHFGKVIIEKDLQSAIHEQQFRLYYQPKCDTQTGKILSFEALIRWFHPTQGMISPDQFIPIAEESGLIKKIGRWTIQEACHQCAFWQNQGLKEVGVAINLSPNEFKDEDLNPYIQQVLLETELPPSLLEIEITEGTLFANSQDTFKRIHELKSIGVKIAIDDFGAGYTSLKYLSNLPIDTLKIDRYFISGIEKQENNKNYAIVKSIIDLAHNLNIEVVAEGVETQSDRDILIMNECDTIQGYLMGKPSPIADIIHSMGGDHESIA